LTVYKKLIGSIKIKELRNLITGLYKENCEYKMKTTKITQIVGDYRELLSIVINTLYLEGI